MAPAGVLHGCGGRMGVQQWRRSCRGHSCKLASSIGTSKAASHSLCPNVTAAKPVARTPDCSILVQGTLHRSASQKPAPCRCNAAKLDSPPVQVKSTQEEDWNKVKEMMEKGQDWIGQIKGINRGGALVQIGELRGFIPFSQLSPKRLNADNKDQQHLLGHTVKARVIEANSDGHRHDLVLSERRALVAEALAGLKHGDVVEGTVKQLTDFGAFVHVALPRDTPVEVVGLIHKSNLSWDRVMTVDSVLLQDQQVKVKVVMVDTVKCLLSLSLKHMAADPLRQTLDSLEWKEESTPLPEVAGVLEELQNTDGVTDARVTRQAEERHIVSQDMEIYMTRASIEDGCKAVIRIGNTLQELELKGTLRRKDFKDALHKALKARRGE